MTPEQSAARDALSAAVECFDFDNVLGPLAITHDAYDDFHDACTPENIRTLLAALDEAQADAARYRWLRDQAPGETNFDHCTGDNFVAIHVPFSGFEAPDLDAAIDAARAGEKP